LITCNNREKDAVREGYNILNEFADKLYGAENVDKIESKDNDSGDSDDDIEDIDIGAALEKEKESLKAISEKKPSERRFQQVESGANNCIFIKTTLDAPDDIVEEIIKDIAETQIQKCRFILRLLPILGTCKAHDKNMRELVHNVLPEAFKQSQGCTYSVLFKTRNTNQVTREDVFKMIHAVVRDVPGGQWKVDLNSPDVSVVVEVIRNVCCVGIVKNFYDKRKYNLVNLVDRGKDDNLEKDSKDEIKDEKDIKEEKVNKDETKEFQVEDGSDHGNLSEIKEEEDIKDEITEEKKTKDIVT